MRRFLAPFALGLGLAWAGVSHAALSMLDMGFLHHSASTTNALTTTTNDCPVGSLVVVTVSYSTVADTLSSVADSGGNTWQTPFDNITTTGLGIGWAYAVNTTVDLPVGATITATFAGSTASSIRAACIGGAATTSPLDTSNHSTGGASGTSAAAVNTGTLAQANEIVVGGLATSATGAGAAATGFTFMSNATGSPSINIGYDIVASTSSVGFTATWNNSAAYVSDVISFKAPGGGAAAHCSVTAMGAGPC